MQKWVLLVFVLVASFGKGVAQTSASSRPVVVYDPTFWKKELHLDHAQYQKMRDINFQFYEKVVSDYRNLNGNQNALKSALHESQQRRNSALLETMNNRQRKKWMRMMVSKA